MRIGEIQEIQATQKFHPAELDEVNGENGRDDAEPEGADQSVVQRPLLAGLRQAEHHHRNDKRVVRAQETFERNQERNGDKIGGLKERKHGG